MLARDVAHEPAARILGLARHGDVLAGLSFEITALGPVEGHLLDEPESIGETLVVLREVGGHLQGRRHGHINSQLVGYRAVGMRMVVGIRLGDILFEDARRVVHRAADQAGERQHGDVERLRTSESLVLGAAGRLVAYEVGPRAAETRGTHGLVGVDHDTVVGRFLHGIEIVVDHPLVVVVVALGDDVAHVARLHGVVAMLVHEAVGRIEVPLVVAHRTRRLVVHDHLHALPAGVAADLLDVEIGIGREEIEDVVFHVAEPVLPADVPALDQHGVESVFGREVDVALDVGRGSSVPAVRADFREVVGVEMGATQLVGVGPRTLARNHLPPDAHILAGLDPRGVLDLAGLVEIERQTRSQDVAGVVRHDHRTPGRRAGALHVGLVAVGIGREVRGEDHAAVVEHEVHGRIVDQGRLVEIDVESVVALELQGRLHAGGRKDGLREVVRDGLFEMTADFGEPRTGIVVLLGVVVARNPPRRVVARHGELGALVGHDEINQLRLLGKLVAEAEAVVVKPEAHDHRAVVGRPAQRDGQFVVTVADVGLLAPDRLPRLVESRSFGLDQLESVAQRLESAGNFISGEGGVELGHGALAAQEQSEPARRHGRTPLAVERIARYALVEREMQRQRAVGRAELLRPENRSRQHQQGGQKKFFHRYHIFRLWFKVMQI